MSSAAAANDEAGKTSNATKRVSKLLDSRIENDKETLKALKELTNYFPDNTIQTRRNLRSQIEKRSVVINRNFLDSFRKVKEHLDAVYDDLKNMNDAVQNMTLQLNSTRAQTHQLIEQTTKLQFENEKLTMQEELVRAFLATFQLTPGELETLREGEISLDFFSALDRVENIHSNCRTLVNSGHQTLALEIMEQMSVYKEAALERLYRWAQAHCKNLDQPGSNQLLAIAMAKLQERQTLFEYVVGAYCTHRRSLLVREFLEALTKGVKGNGGTLKPPLELSAHDPYVYVTEMLHFLEQALSNQNLSSLFINCDKIDVVEVSKGALANISEGVCTPLKNRIDHTIVSPELPLKTLYGIISILNHEKEALFPLMGDAGLVKGLAEMEKACGDRLLPCLSVVVKKEVVDRVSVPPAGLNPSPGIESLLALLRNLLSVPPHHGYLEKIVHGILEPLIQGINVSASRLATTDMSVYLLNCIHLVLNTLVLYEFMDDWLERLQAQCDAQIDTLTSEQASSLVANLNLSPIYTILQEGSKSAGSSGSAVIQPTALNTFTAKFERYLSMPEILTLPQVECLMSMSHRSQVLRRATQVIIAIYKQLYEFVHNPTSGYESPSDLLPRTPEDVTNALGGCIQLPGASFASHPQEPKVV